MRKNFTHFSLTLLLSLLTMVAHAAVINGKVIDKKTKQPIIGVTVIEKGTGNGAITMEGGEFTVNTSSDKTVLEFAFLGYETQDVPVEGSTTIIVEMQEGGIHLDDVVVIGYGTSTVKSNAGSIASVKSDDLNDYPSASFASALSGQATGVQIIQPNGAPGTQAEIRVRGIGTLTAGGNPLIVVDGFPLTEGTDINSINPNAIESIEILKDAASTAIYGSRGANGIIMIKTKQGKSGKPQVAITASFGMQQRQDDVELVDAYDFAQFQKEARNTGYVNIDPVNRSENDSNEVRVANGASKRQLLPDYIMPYLAGEQGLTNTDWYDEIFRLAAIQDYNLSITGGSDHSSYSITGGYLSQEGILIGSDYEKISSNINLQLRPTDNITFGASLSPSYTTKNFTQESGTWGGRLHAMASISYPFFNVYNEDGSYAISEQINANAEADGALGENPVAWANMLTNTLNTARMFGNAYAEIDFFDAVKYKINVGADYESETYDFFKPSTIGQYRDPAPSPADAERELGNTMNYIIENTLTFKKDFGSHGLQFLLGQSFQKEEYNSLGVEASGFVDNSIENVAGGSSFGVNPGQYAWSMMSYFSRVNYNFDNKYMLNASVRWDGSSRFGEDSKWGLFPAVSGAWLVSNENFLQNSDVIDFAKLRLSWGKSGNNQITNYGALAVMGGSDYIFGGTLAPGTVISTAPNTNLSWEMTSTINAGIDLTLMKYLGVSADFYVATTNDLLLSVPVPQQSGYETSLQNIGSVRNTGLEVRLYTAQDLKFGDLYWNSSLNFTTNKDEVLALADGQTQIIVGDNITEVGGRIGALYGYDVIGLYKSQADFDKYPSMAGTQIGDYIIKDLNGDGKITTDDKKSYGSPAPKVILGFNNKLRYKAWELTFDIYAELGKQKNSGTLQSLECGEGFMMVTQDYFDNRYHPINNPNGTHATPNMGNYSNTRKQAAASNVFFVDASYASLRNLKLSYDLPTSFLNKIGIGRAQVYALANNLIVLTPYRGFNVEAESNSSILEQGEEKYAYPMSSTISLGVNVNF